VFIIKNNRKNEIKVMLCSCEDIINSNEFFKELQELGENLRKDDLLNNLLIFLSALGNKERFIIFTSLKENDRCVCELEVILKKSQSSISHHLRKLVVAGLIQGYKKQKFTYYHLFQEELVKNLDILKQALHHI